MSAPGSDGRSDLVAQAASDDFGAKGDSIQAAVARTFGRGLALYFARPVRLFRPSKVNGWQTLRNQAHSEGSSMTMEYVLSLVRLQGVTVLTKHFVPPMLVNAAVGTVLWQTYGTASELLEPLLGLDTLSKASVSGGIAGACQALLAAPAENVRLLLQRGFTGQSWSCAWKEVFLSDSNVKQHKTTHEIRELRSWLHEVRQMAGRGWNGWGWGCAKDTFGFAAFFTIFEISRRAGASAKTHALDWTHRQPVGKWERIPAIVNGTMLVTGGVVAGIAYETACRPWDVARRLIYEARFDSTFQKFTVLGTLKRHFVENGVLGFFRAAHEAHHTVEAVSRWTIFLRTMGRVGPWGVGFLVWEASGQGLA